MQPSPYLPPDIRHPERSVPSNISKFTSTVFRTAEDAEKILRLPPEDAVPVSDELRDLFVPLLEDTLKDTHAILTRIAAAYGLPPPARFSVERIRLLEEQSDGYGRGEYYADSHEFDIWLDPDFLRSDPAATTMILQLCVHEYIHATCTPYGYSPPIYEGVTQYLTNYACSRMGLSTDWHYPEHYTPKNLRLMEQNMELLGDMDMPKWREDIMSVESSAF